MPLPALLIFCFWGVVLLAMVAVVVRAVRRSRRGSVAIADRGWTRLPDGDEVVRGWDGWPFLEALEPGRAVDVVTGDLEGSRFLALRWSQRESAPAEASRTDVQRYNILALATEQHYPHLTVVRGRRRLSERQQRPGVTDFDTGDRHFDRRWQALGDADFGRAVLGEELRAAMDEQNHAWVFQPGWITRVVPWTFWAGEEQMVEEIRELAALVRLVPAEAWAAYGGAPRFLQNLGYR